MYLVFKTLTYGSFLPKAFSYHLSQKTTFTALCDTYWILSDSMSVLNMPNTVNHKLYKNYHGHIVMFGTKKIARVIQISQLNFEYKLTYLKLA